MRWKVHGRKLIYQSPWVDLYLDNVELPDGQRLDHHVLSMPKPSVGTVVLDGEGNTLLVWRHRFIPDVWGWETPAGWAEPGEDLTKAAVREVEEETGWTVDNLSPLIEYNPLSGMSDWRYTAYLGTQPRQVSTPDQTETSKVEWIPLQRIPDLISTGQIQDGPTMLMLTYLLSAQLGS